MKVLHIFPLLLLLLNAAAQTDDLEKGAEYETHFRRSNLP